jgi:hypothetical protein
MAFTFIDAVSIDTGDPDPTGTPGTVLTTVDALNVAANDVLVYVAKFETPLSRSRRTRAHRRTRSRAA